ncbi:GTPase Era [Sphingorhabdus arenilitoris]|uniref:GTPase Era n=1 Tax=Sphingorhabdus arenilitoris TaxID=1490041 RepID=A0ABV8RIK5_9SPHN
MNRKCGHIAIIGAPNAGKSTLVNALVGQKVAIVSPKAQTTRARLMGVAMLGETQMILVDTPGIFAPQRKLDRAMVSAAWDGASGADLIALVVDGRKGAGPKVEQIVEALARREEPKWLILNKVDIARKDKLLALAAKLNELCTFDQNFFISALDGEGIDKIKAAFADVMPAGEWHFPEDQVSDITDRLLASEITREQLYHKLHEELPYAATVVTEQYLERADGSLEIHQQIIVQRDTQRGIVLGKGGQMIKSIGETARHEISELMGGCPVHLYLHVKVKADWDESPEIYEGIGLEWSR